MELYGPVEPPALELEDVHTVADDFWYALTLSRQTRYFGRAGQAMALSGAR